MLPKLRRIQRNTFSDFVNGAKVFKNDLFFVKTAKSSSKSRFSFSVSKKVVKSAVVRNKMRRWGYFSIEKNIKRLSDGGLVNFSFKKEPNSREEVLDSVEQILKISKILN